MLGGSHLYVIQMAVTGDFKVGRSDNVPRRLAQLQTGSPHRLKILLDAPGLGHREVFVHNTLRAFRCRRGKGEWFYETGIGSIPVDLWERVPEAIREDPDWWKRPRR